MRPYPNRDRALRHVRRQQAASFQAAIGRLIAELSLQAGLDVAHLKGISTDVLRQHQQYEARLAAHARRTSAAFSRALQVATHEIGWAYTGHVGPGPGSLNVTLEPMLLPTGE
ncbi:hypothetical protein AB0M23_28450 [Streptomyces sp. NPDC052077]|uniref:hypothetical protein n=1 Tax=Streptomyces sp. NPDC052077 TaxID=3154757 RepID=UPI00341F572E